MDNLTIPFLGPERSTWQYPFRSLPGGRRDARDGLRLERLDRRTRCSRWRSRSTGSRTSAAARSRRSCPTSGSTWSTRWRRSRPGPRASTTSSTRSARSRSARRPTSSSSTATCSIAGAGAIGEARVVGTFVDGDAGLRGPGARRLTARARRPHRGSRHGRMTMSSWRRMSVSGASPGRRCSPCATQPGTAERRAPVNAYAYLHREPPPRLPARAGLEAAASRRAVSSAEPSRSDRVGRRWRPPGVRPGRALRAGSPEPRTLSVPGLSPTLSSALPPKRRRPPLSSGGGLRVSAERPALARAGRPACRCRGGSAHPGRWLARSPRR